MRVSHSKSFHWCAGLFVFSLFAALITACSKSSSQGGEAAWVTEPGKKLRNVQHFAFHSDTMGHEIGVSVSLPRDYASSEESYPVIYYLHGYRGSENSDVKGFAPFLRKSLKKHNLPEPIIVFPNGGNRHYLGEQEHMLINELIPHIESQYRVRTQPNYRTLAGFSMGGAGAISLSLRHPGMFGGAASWGGGLWRESETQLDAAREHATLFKKMGFHALMVNGDIDRPNAFTPLAEVFEQQGIAHQHIILPKVDHNLGLYFKYTGDAYAEHLKAIWSE